MRKIVQAVSYVHSVAMGETFLYFGYGSNLLKERLRIMNPSAQFVCTAKLPNYKLDFKRIESDPIWMGGAGDIVEAPEEQVWGVVWQMAAEDKANIDRQEGVEVGFYRPLSVQVETLDGRKLTCRTYQIACPNVGDPRPSPHYLNVLIRGAQQNSLPEDYITYLENIDTNGYQGEVKIHGDILKLLGEK